MRHFTSFLRSLAATSHQGSSSERNQKQEQEETKPGVVIEQLTARDVAGPQRWLNYWYQRHGYREQGQNLNYNHISSFQPSKSSVPLHSGTKRCLLPTSDIEDAFSSMNILNYTSVSSDYFPASSESRSFNSSRNSTDNIIPSVFSPFYNNPCLKDVQAFYAQKFPISSPDPITPPAILTPSPVFKIGKCSDKRYLKHHEKQVEDILNYLDELYLHRIERMEEGRINGNELKTELKEIRIQIVKLQKKRLGQKDKIAFAHYRISNLERIIEKIQARHQTNQEDL
ncbi:hypothetical protein Tco_0954113 [Tanacetum coccineum]|uniref:Ribosomal protein S15 n=1 Tax=Tanacetum coccineum TaxID=301880 RepID=A0ABQ5E251_9ASTR